MDQDPGLPDREGPADRLPEVNPGDQQVGPAESRIHVGLSGFGDGALPSFPREDGDLPLAPGGRRTLKSLAADQLPFGTEDHGLAAGPLGPDGEQAAAFAVTG